MKPEDKKNIILLALMSVVFFFLGNNLLPLTDPDEVFYVQTAKEMAQRPAWMVPYLFGEPQFEKPILTYWLLRIAMEIFGPTPFAARFFPALFALIGALALYAMARAGFKDSRRAYAAALMLMSGGLYLGMARTVFTDLIFSVFILLSLAAFYLVYAGSLSRTLGALLSGIFSGAAVLTKGPLGFLIPLAAVLVFLAIRRELRFLRHAAWTWALVLGALVAVPWYAAMVSQYGQAFITEFFYNDHWRRLIEAEHISNDTWFFYPASMLLCMFPWTVFSAGAFYYLQRKLVRRNAAAFDIFALAWITVTFLIFQAAHSKLTSYILPMFPAIALLTADFWAQGTPGARRWCARITWGVLALFPVGFVGAAGHFKAYVPSPAPVIFFAVLFAAQLIVILLFLIRERWPIVMHLMAFQLVFMLIFALGMAPQYEQFVASRRICAGMPPEALAGPSKILCAKFLARGVRFYTDRDVAVVDINGSNYFSPHPIPYLNTDAKVVDFLRAQRVTYAVATKSSFEDLRRITKAHGINFKELRQEGDKRLALITAEAPDGAHPSL